MDRTLGSTSAAGASGPRRQNDSPGIHGGLARLDGHATAMHSSMAAMQCEHRRKGQNDMPQRRQVSCQSI